MPGTKRTGKRHKPATFIPAYRNPVAKAIVLKLMEAEMRDEGIATLMLQQGEPVAETLAHQAWIVGVGAEVAVAVHGTSSPETRRLHGSLRAIEAMCLQHDYCWQTVNALAIEHALAEAKALITEHPELAQERKGNADYLAWLITNKRLMPGVIAGAELYQQPQSTEAHHAHR